MNYIVLDMEWNQPYSANLKIKKPVMLYGEIVQIGAVKLDENCRILDTFKIMVAPKYYTRMNKMVSQLTSITDEQLRYGFAFPDAFRHFSRWCGEEFAFFTWGTDDINMLRDNMILHGLDTGWIPDTYNIQVIFDNQVTKENRQVSLLYAMDKIGEPALDAHDALNDARNTAVVCLHLDMEKGLADYIALQKKLNCYGRRAAERNRSGKTYESKNEAFMDPELLRFVCPECGMNAECTGIVKQNTNKFICIGRCSNGDEMFVRLRFTKRADDCFSVSRIIYKMDDANREYYMKRRKHAVPVSRPAPPADKAAD